MLSFCHSFWIARISQCHLWWHSILRRIQCRNHDVHFWQSWKEIEYSIVESIFKWNVWSTKCSEIWKNYIIARSSFTSTFSLSLSYHLNSIFTLRFRLLFVDFKAKVNGKDENLTNWWTKDKRNEYEKNILGNPKNHILFWVKKIYSFGFIVSFLSIFQAEDVLFTCKQNKSEQFFFAIIHFH